MLVKVKRTIAPLIAATILTTVISVDSANAMTTGNYKEIDLTINNETKTIETKAKTIEEILDKVEYEHKDTDKMNYKLNDKVFDEMKVFISSEKKVSLQVKENNIETTTNSNTVAELLKELKIQVSENDIVIPSLDSNLKDDDKIVVIYQEKEVYTKSEPIKFETKRSFSFDVPYGETKVITKGHDGELEKTFLKVTKNNIIISDKETGETVKSKPVAEEILVGTKEVINRDIENETITVQNESLYQGESRVVQQGQKGNEQSIYENDGTNRVLKSKIITAEPIDRIVEIGTKIKPVAPKPVAPKKQVKSNSDSTGYSSSKAMYSLGDLQFHGVINHGGKKYTYYSQSVLPGGGLKIPGRHINSAGYIADSNGYIVIASHHSIPKGTIIDTPFGYKGKVYDMCASCTSTNWYDVYTK